MRSNIEHSSFTELVVHSVISVGAYLSHLLVMQWLCLIVLLRITMFVFVCVCASTVRLNVFIFLLEKVKYMITCWMSRPIKVNKIIAHHYAFILWSEENLYSNYYMHCYSYYISTYHTHTLTEWNIDMVSKISLHHADFDL